VKGNARVADRRPFPSTSARGKLIAELRLLGSIEWGVEPMPQYIMLVNFTDQGVKGIKDVLNRQDKSRETAKQFGVERKTVWMTFGPYDFVHLYEAPATKRWQNS
jgi:hypothetical protein